MRPPILRDVVNRFTNSVTTNFGAATAIPAQSEDQLKPAVVHLLQEAGRELGFSAVVARTEAFASELGVRPDVGVSVDRLLTGHVELKAPGKGARARAFADDHDREQFRRLSGHPNLLYTDGNEWALYRLGVQVGELVRATGDIRSDGEAAYTDAECRALEKLLRDFLFWQPIVPRSPKVLADLLAPLTQLLREGVRESLRNPSSALASLASQWRSVLFADADDAEFADAYAQTVTYALLLARVEGETDLRSKAAEALDERHGLLAQVLRVLAQADARSEVDVPVSLLERAIEAVDPGELERHAHSSRDIWLYFYEDFLATYDPKLRRQRGVYFTPAQVVQTQVRLVAELLRDRFGRELGFASDDVVVLDPAVGTGTYLLAALEHGAQTVVEQYGEGAAPGRVAGMARQFHGFELLVGPYAVAHLRFAQDVLRLRGELPTDGSHIYLTDTLESPYAAPQRLAQAPLFERRLAQENERARHVKAEVPVLVCIGNPPYFRQVIDPEEEGVERQGGWVRRGDEGNDGILRDFIRGTPPVHAKNLYNLYVYFWRWALWKVCESGPRTGIISFITASSYLRGPGFAGMRRHMREVFDELWILDLGGEGRGARRSENVFAIQTPVAIAIGVRSDAGDVGTPATVRYARIDGTQAEKLSALDAIEEFADVSWQQCFEGWAEPFLPESAGDYFSWPSLTDLFPWQHSGIKTGRTWPVAPDRETLNARWETLVAAPSGDRRTLFKNSPTGRKVDQEARGLPPHSDLRLEALETATGNERPGIVPYAFRSLDRQYLIADRRVIDRPGPSLWSIWSARQVHLTSLLTGLLGAGPAVIATHLLPDLHHFRGSFGGRDTIPLWRDAGATEPNLPAALRSTVSGHLGHSVSAEDILSYVYALLSAPTYTARFVDELEIPGPRIPVTRDPAMFGRAVELGRELVWLHTFGERFVPQGERAGRVPQGRARNTRAIPPRADGYPERHAYDEARHELNVGEGIFTPVTPEVRWFSVSGFDVVGSWLGYRMKTGAGRQSSPLDGIRPSVWPAEFTEELLRVLWILERTVELGPQLDEALEVVVTGPVLRAVELPQPTETERQPPA